MRFYRQCYLRQVGTHTRQIVYIPEELAVVDGLVEVKDDKTNWTVLTVGAYRTPADQLDTKYKNYKSFGGSIK